MADQQPAPCCPNQLYPPLPGLALLLYAISSVVRSPADCCRRRAGRWAACCRGQAAAAASGQAWPGAGHSWLRLVAAKPQRNPALLPRRPALPAVSRSRPAFPDVLRCSLFWKETKDFALKLEESEGVK